MRPAIWPGASAFFRPGPTSTGLLYTDGVALTPTTGWASSTSSAGWRPTSTPTPCVRRWTRPRADGYQVIPVVLLGHKADLGLMALGPDVWRLRRLQTEAATAGLVPAHSYVSLTEVSEYAAGVPEDMRQARSPDAPPEGMAGLLLLPDVQASRRRGHNWYALDYEDRKRLMTGHGAMGRTFRGRVLQLITGSTGLDDYEWGVTLFGDPSRRPEGLRLRDAFRRGLGPLRRVRTLLHRNGRHTRRGARGHRGDAVHERANVASTAPQDELRRLGRVVVAFTGGADSAFLAQVAPRPSAAPTCSASPRTRPRWHGRRAGLPRPCEEWGLRWVVVTTDEMEDADYVANDPTVVLAARPS